MAAGKYNLLIEQGATYQVEIQYKDSNGVAVDLTGYSGKLQIRPFPGSPIAYICLSSSLQPDGTGLNFSGSYGNTPPIFNPISRLPVINHPRTTVSIVPTSLHVIDLSMCLILSGLIIYLPVSFVHGF